jgi:poly-gamma-glutamate synthesis protein (capsule biosynthesis protein)
MIGGSKLGLSTYPSFNSPQEVGDALKDIGVDFVTLANNHTLDRGEAVIQSALSYWDKIAIPYTGSYKNQEDADTIRIVEKNGIRFAILSYTYGTNGIPVPSGKSYLVNLIDMNKIKSDVGKTRSAENNVDVVIVAMHWGAEYQDFPNDEQKEWAQELADMCVDIAIGNHPHVLQPPAWVIGKDGHKMFVFYSLGNFISSQKELKQRLGGIGAIDVVKTMDGESSSIVLENPAFEPVYDYYANGHDFSIIPMKMLKESQLSGAASKMAETMKHMRTYIPDLEQN